MTPGEWIALAALVLSICGGTAVLATRLGKLEGKVFNGLTTAITDLKTEVGKLHKKFDGRPCEQHEVTLSQIHRMLEEAKQPGEQRP